MNDNVSQIFSFGQIFSYIQFQNVSQIFSFGQIFSYIQFHFSTSPFTSYLKCLPTVSNITIRKILHYPSAALTKIMDKLLKSNQALISKRLWRLRRQYSLLHRLYLKHK